MQRAEPSRSAVPSSEPEPKAEGLAELYAHPDLYDALRPVDPVVAHWVDVELEAIAPSPGARVFDPACGPGGWLERFAARGLRVAGNDLSTEMLAAARARLGEACLELTNRDMRDLAFEAAPFDLAVEPSSVLSELDDAGLLEHLVSVGSQLGPSGHYVMMTLIDDRPEAPVDPLLFETTAELRDGGHIKGAYRLLERVPGDHWSIERRVECVRPEGKSEVVDRYALHARSLRSMRQLAEAAGFELLRTRCSETGALVPPDEPGVSDCIFVLRKR
jgi:SAM-dependent methyltransferase